MNLTSATPVDGTFVAFVRFRNERAMTEAPRPLLVYDRIDANRRRTRLLLASFALALLPVVSGGAAFVFPFIHIMYASVRTADLRAMDLTSLLWLNGGFFLVSMAIAAALLVATADRLISNYASGFVLRLARARPVDSGGEPELVQMVENLCVGAGLIVPRIHVIESGAPNAFATGLSAADASLVVTRGLLQVLDRRELEGVIAHELSHIGSHDIALSTTLAALIGTVNFPLKALTAPVRAAWSFPGALRVVATAFVLLLLLQAERLVTLWWTIGAFIFSTALYLPRGPFTWWWGVYAIILPLYAVFGAPGAVLLIRQAVSRQRQFLADADAALLTRDPEGLALALVKIGAVRGERLQAGESTAHLYFVDPLSTSWLHILLPSHPPLEKRVALLAGMGNGIAPSDIQAARDAAARVQFRKSGTEALDAPLPDLSRDETPPAESSGFDGFTRLYDQPVDGSRLLALLPQGTIVKLEGIDGDFMRVTTRDGTAGYILGSAFQLAQRR
jgi:heat shock protein HtpX